MHIVPFPVQRVAGHAERLALRQAVAGRLDTARPQLRVVARGREAFCANCAGVVDFGAVWRGGDVYCSVECSLGGGRPA